MKENKNAIFCLSPNKKGEFFHESEEAEKEADKYFDSLIFKTNKVKHDTNTAFNGRNRIIENSEQRRRKRKSR